MILVNPDKSRYVWLYAPSKDDTQRWAGLAKKAKVPFSKFIISKFEDALAADSEKKPNAKLIEEIEDVRKENKALREDIRQKSLILAKYEADIKHYQSKEFLDLDRAGFDYELVEGLGPFVASFVIYFPANLGHDPSGR
jgi:hypothetical protein